MNNTMSKKDSKLEVIIGKYATILPLFFGIIPVVIVYVCLLVFTLGDISTATQILIEVGVLNLWLQGVGTLIQLLLYYLTIISIALAIIKRKELFHYSPERIAAVGALPLIFISMLLPIGLIIFIALAIILILIKRFVSYAANNVFDFKNKLQRKKTVSDKNLNPTLTDKLALIVVFLTLFVIVRFPSVPNTQLVMKDKSTIVGIVFKETSDWITIVEDKNRAIRYVKAKDVKSKFLCEKQGKSNYPFKEQILASDRSILSLLSNSQTLKGCP